MKWRIIIILLFVLAIQVSAQDTTPIEPTTIIEGEDAELNLFFRGIKQGRVGLISVMGDNIEGVRVNIFARQMPVFQMDDAYYALITVPMEQAIRNYQLVVEVEQGADAPQILQGAVIVEDGGFIQQSVILPPGDELETLLNHEVEDNELAQLFEIAEPVTDEPLWNDAGFMFPIRSELTSPFGAVRLFNEDYDSLHTGWDFQAVTGQPLVAVASGEVAFSNHLDIRGNYVMVNHGVGVYSGYAHLSVVYVTQGQHVEAGQIIGIVGSTGRSSSAHAHLEFIVDGYWVDAADFITMYLP